MSSYTLYESSAMLNSIHLIAQSPNGGCDVAQIASPHQSGVLAIWNDIVSGLPTIRTYRVAAQIEMPSTPISSVCTYLGNLLAFGSALNSPYFAAIMLHASTREQAGSQWRPLPLQMRHA